MAVASWRKKSGHQRQGLRRNRDKGFTVIMNVFNKAGVFMAVVKKPLATTDLTAKQTTKGVEVK